MIKGLNVKKATALAAKLAQRYRAPLCAFALVLAFGTVAVGGGFPFGIALYTAMPTCPAPGFAALCLAALISGAPLISLPVALGLFACKKLWEGRAQKPFAKPLAALTAISFVWASGVSEGIYTLAQSAPWLILAPLFTLLYGYGMDGDCKKPLHHGGMAAMLFTTMLFLNGILPFPTLVRGLALLIAFVGATRGGMLYGGLYGFAAGLGCGTACGAVAAVVAFCGGLFSVIGTLGALLCGTGAGLCTGFYFFGPQSTLSLCLSFALAWGGFAYFKDKLAFLPLGAIPLDDTRPHRGRERFAEAFFAIAQSTRNCDSESDARRTADQYAGISSLLTAAEERRETEEHIDRALSSRAATLLYGAGVRAQSIRVTGGRKKQLIAERVEVDRLTLSSVELKQLMSVALGCTMSEPMFFPAEEGVRLVMESAPRFRIECARSGCPKKGEEVSGDTVSFFSGEGGYFYALISDGMGSGRAAAESSRLAGMFLEKLLSAGADRRTALSLLNGFLAARKEEVFATVDLFEADLYTGKGVLTKAGAAPSFIMRGGSCRKLQSATAPAGIIRDIRAEQLSFDLKDGDTLIMLSDGISGDGDGEEAQALLSSLKGATATAAIADLLVSDGARRLGNSDDISVCVIKILAA